MNRKSLIEKVRTGPDFVWDIIVIGGGATGLGVALDGATRGYSVLLLERSDFAQATSSRSTKLVHGGVRYMAQGDLLLVIEALHERGILLRNAPHLTADQEFIIPVYSLWDKFLYTAGLKFYDLLAGRLSLGKSYFISRKETLAKLPLLVSGRLKGGVVYHDGQFDDSRMALSLADACVRQGGVVLNYFNVTGFIKDEKGKISGVHATDVATDKKFSFNAGVVINATGVFADELHRMDDPGSRPTIKPSQGVHLVIDKSFLGGDSAIMIPKTDDGRVLFAIPWYDKVVVGTTDTPLDKISTEPKALDSEIDFILNTAGKYLVKPPVRSDILSVFAGLRPLAADPGNPGATREVSRRHKITLSESQLLSIIGGKWTTYRRMAQETIDRAIKAKLLAKADCKTSDYLFSAQTNLKEAGRLRIYGDHYADIEDLIRKNPDAGLALDPRLPYSRAEIQWICRNEMPVNLEDVLARRTRALYLDARASMDIAPVVASLMATETGCDSLWEKEQVDAFRRLAENYI